MNLKEKAFDLFNKGVLEKEARDILNCNINTLRTYYSEFRLNKFDPEEKTFRVLSNRIHSNKRISNKYIYCWILLEKGIELKQIVDFYELAKSTVYEIKRLYVIEFKLNEIATAIDISKYKCATSAYGHYFSKFELCKQIPLIESYNESTQIKIEEIKSNIEEIKNNKQEVVNEIQRVKLNSIFSKQLFIKNSKVNIDFGKDINGLIWVDFEKLFDVCKNILDINKDDFDINVKYLAQGMMKNKLTLLLDENYLLQFATLVKDSSFINSVIQDKVGEKSIEYKIQEIVNGIDMINLISDEKIKTQNSYLEAFEAAEQDLKHKLEKEDPNSQLYLEIGEKLAKLVKRRRRYKILFNTGSHINTILSAPATNDNVFRVLNNLKTNLLSLKNASDEKIYNSRVDKLQEWQKDLIKDIM